MPNKVPEGRPSTGPSVPTPGGPSPVPDRPSVPTGDTGDGGVQPQPTSPATPPGINLTGGDREEVPDLDAELLDIALMEDPDAGGEVFGQATLHTTPIDDGGEVVDDPDGGGPVAMDGLHLLAQVNHLAAQTASDDVAPPPPPPPPPPPKRMATDDPDGGGESALQTTPIDDGGEIFPGAELHLAMPADDGGEIFQGAELSGDPDGGGEIVGDPDGGGEVENNRALKEQVRSLQKTLGEYKMDGPEAPGDPDGGGEIVSDPDGGDELDGDFGTGAMPPQPVTMTIDDLQGDPDGGGELTDDPDGGGEIASRPPLDGIGIDDLTVAEDPDGGGEVAWGADDGTTVADVEHGVQPPPPDFTDLEVSGTFDEAGHTFEGE